MPDDCNMSHKYCHWNKLHSFSLRNYYLYITNEATEKISYMCKFMQTVSGREGAITQCSTLQSASSTYTIKKKCQQLSAVFLGFDFKNRNSRRHCCGADLKYATIRRKKVWNHSLGPALSLSEVLNACLAWFCFQCTI